MAEEKAGGLWAALEQATESTEDEGPRASGMGLWDTVRDRLDFSKAKPRRLPNTEVARQRTSRGEEYFVLRNPEANTYLKLGPEDYFLWEQLDGQSSVRDLAVAYVARYGSMPFQRLPHLLAQLRSHRLLAEQPIEVFDTLASRSAAKGIGYRLEAFSKTALQKELSFKNADGFFDALYRRVGWILFTRPAMAIYAVLAVVGLYFFVTDLLAGTYPLLQTAGSYGLGLLVLLLADYGGTFIHESGHALTCKHYGRHVPKGGVLLYYGTPCFFVDTTDIWMAPKRARLLVSFAGPLATLLVGALFSVIVALVPGSSLAPVFFQIAFVSWVGFVMNLDPLIEADGYFLLMDWLEIPRLRAKSLAFVRADLWKKLRERVRLGREERILTVYGCLAAVYAVFTIGLAVYLWQSQIQVMLADLVSGRDVLSSVLAGGLIVLAGGTLVVGLATKGYVFASKGIVWLSAWLARRRRKVARSA